MRSTDIEVKESDVIDSRTYGAAAMQQTARLLRLAIRHQGF